MMSAVSAVLDKVEAPDEVGVPSAAIRRFLTRLERRGLNTHSLLIARERKLAFEAYWWPYTAATPHRLYSASKSYVAVAIGALADDGQLDLSDRVIDHFPDKVPSGPVHPYVAEMRVADLLTMRTAHGTTTYKRAEDTDWVRTFFTVPPSRRPGAVFSYDTSATVVLTALVEQISAQRLPEFLMDRVLRRIGVEVAPTALLSPTGMAVDKLGGHPTAREVEVNPAGVAHGGSGLFCTPRDFLRFAQLCLDQGRWGDDQVVSAEFMRAATGYQAATRHTAGRFPDSQCGYGFQFWRNQHGGFSARGMGGQIALCLPGHDLVIVTTGDNQPVAGADQAFFDAVWEELLPALTDPAPADPAAADDLADLVASLSLTPVPVVAGVAPGEVSATWQLDEGVVPFARLGLDVGATGGELRLVTPDGQDRTFPFGIGTFVRHDLPGYGYETFSSAAWLDVHTLHLRSQVIGRYYGQLDLTVAVQADSATVVMNRAAEMFAEEYEGTVSGRLLS